VAPADGSGSEEKTDLAGEAWRIVAELFMGRTGRAAEIANAYGLTPGHMKALLTIEPGEPKPMGALAEALHCDASNITWLVDRLEERGYVERRLHPADRRVRTVALTDEGIRVREGIEAKLYEPPDEFLALDSANLDELCTLLRKVVPPQ
jgi:DNA-binding MarR family transcriptional regulator